MTAAPEAMLGAEELPVPTPADELGALVGWGAALFYLAEAEVNPGVATYWDALHYIAASLSVGGTNVFPMTTLGKTIASAVMALGPSLSARALGMRHDLAGSSPAALTAAPPDAAYQRAVVERLDAILLELQRAR
jgi:hypothetical protein